MFAKVILHLAIFAFTFSLIKGQFVKKISEVEYELNFNEHGALYTQRVTFENDLVITEVPAHHDRVALKYIYDSSNGLALTIHPTSMLCELTRPFIGMSGAEQKEYLDDAALDDSPEDRLEVNSTTTSLYELAHIEGPEVDSECIPKSFRKFVPKSFRIFLSHEVQITKENVERSRSNQTKLIYTDPLSQKRYEKGDHVEMFGEVFDFLPTCVPKQQRRVKREQAEREWSHTGPDAVHHADGTTSYWEQSCINEEGNTIRCYGLHSVDCDGGCDADMTGYDCTGKERDCHFILVCPIVKGENCISHLLTERLFSCIPCCRTIDCGPNMGQCENGRDSMIDTCPTDNKGCPYDLVDKKKNKQVLSNITCQIGDECDYVMSANGNAIGSGVSCGKAKRKRNYLETFCCRQPTSDTSDTSRYTTDLLDCA